MTTSGWGQWCDARVDEARAFGQLCGINIETAMFRRLYANVAELQARFPDIPLDVALQDLVWSAVKADHEDDKRRAKDK